MLHEKPVAAQFHETCVCDCFVYVGLGFKISIFLRVFILYEFSFEIVTYEVTL